MSGTLPRSPFLSYARLPLRCDRGSVDFCSCVPQDKTFDVATFRPVSAVYDRQGRFLVLGSTTGVVLVLQATDLQQFQAPLVTGKSTITDIAFSPDGYYMATAGADNAVTIFRFLETEVKLSSEALGGRQEWELDEHERSKARRMVEQWVLIGRYKAHSKPITGLRFGMSAEGAPLLVSTGEDKYLVEYDLEGSSVKDGIQLRGGRTKVILLLLLAAVAALIVFVCDDAD